MSGFIWDAGSTVWTDVDVSRADKSDYAVTEVMATRDAEWWLECRKERIPFYSRLGFDLVEPGDVPASVRQLVRSRTDREQFFMHRP